jgi:hypothetical protein
MEEVEMRTGWRRVAGLEEVRKGWRVEEVRKERAWKVMGMIEGS